VSARKPFTTRRVKFLSRSIEATPWRSRAQEIVVTGAIDRAVWELNVINNLICVAPCQQIPVERNLNIINNLIYVVLWPKIPWL
jgi:hypothetical protein